MSALATTFARSCGYAGNSPALLRAFEAIRQHGIREARADHYRHLAVIRQYAEHPAMFFAAIRPSLSTDEAIEDANAFIRQFRSMESWRQERNLIRLRKAKEKRVFARYFRRFGLRLWAKQAA